MMKRAVRHTRKAARKFDFRKNIVTWLALAGVLTVGIYYAVTGGLFTGSQASTIYVAKFLTPQKGDNWAVGEQKDILMVLNLLPDTLVPEATINVSLQQRGVVLGQVGSLKVSPTSGTVIMPWKVGYDSSGQLITGLPRDSVQLVATVGQYGRGSEVFNLIDSKERIIYVANRGNDEAGDGSQLRPYRSIGKAMSQVPATGDFNTHIVIADKKYAILPPVKESDGSTTCYNEGRLRTDGHVGLSAPERAVIVPNAGCGQVGVLVEQGILEISNLEWQVALRGNTERSGNLLIGENIFSSSPTSNYTRSLDIATSNGGTIRVVENKFKINNPSMYSGAITTGNMQGVGGKIEIIRNSFQFPVIGSQNKIGVQLAAQPGARGYEVGIADNYFFSASKRIGLRGAQHVGIAIWPSFVGANAGQLTELNEFGQFVGTPVLEGAI